jgi:uncharacterized membrane protein YhfC
MDNTNLYWTLASAAGMMLVGVGAVIYWRWRTELEYRWFWVGAGLWTVAVAIKFAIAIPTFEPLANYLKASLPYSAYLVAGGLYGGLLSSFTEVGLTWLAVIRWRQLGRDAGRAIGIGVGAGGFEALLLGMALAGTMVALLANVQGTAPIREQLDRTAATMPLFWLAAPVERIIAILCHASSRALVILGSVQRRPWMIVGGFGIFTFIDGVATAAHLSGKLGMFSMWWIELAILPAAIVSIPVLWWCYARWGGGCGQDKPSLDAAPANRP